MKTCKVDDCNNKHFGKGYCSKHYQRYKKYGDPLYLKIKHNAHGKASTSEYHTWESIIQRCNNPKAIRYNRYGGRGITICDRWLHSFSNFYEDIGAKPFLKAQIDRIDNNGNYEPSNCHWVTCAENCHNTSKTKLSMKLANEIRHEYAKNKTTHRSLAKIYNTDHRSIGRIVNNQLWKEELQNES